jgi:phage terminase large subunit
MPRTKTLATEQTPPKQITKSKQIIEPKPKRIVDPKYYAKKTLGLTSWSKMDEIYNAVREGKRKILVRSCNGAGKTTALAALCLWKLQHFPDSIILTTASSWTQVSRSLWGEIRQQARRADLYNDKQLSSTQIKLDDKHYAIGLSPGLPENAQGFHAPSMLIAVDEATGVDREIIDALWGNATSKDAQMILIYNPIDATSFPFEAEETGDWHIITISAFDHPNVKSGTEIIPGAVTREWIEDRLKAWSYEVDPKEDENALYIPWLDKYFKKTERIATRVCGEWPLDGGESFIDPLLIRNALSVKVVPGERAMGVDIARSGNDKTVFAFFDGNTQLPFECFFGKNLMKTANRIAELYKLGWRTITLDDTGVGGGVTDRLRELGIPVCAVNFSQSPKNVIRFKDVSNARAEMYFVLEEELRRGEISITNDKELHQELIAPRLKIAPGGAYALEEKSAITSRLGRSPDKADATALARYGLRLTARNMPHLF